MITVKSGIYTEEAKSTSLYLVKELDTSAECQNYMLEHPLEFDEGKDYLIIPIIRIKR